MLLLKLLFLLFNVLLSYGGMIMKLGLELNASPKLVGIDIPTSHLLIELGWRVIIDRNIDWFLYFSATTIVSSKGANSRTFQSAVLASQNLLLLLLLRGWFICWWISWMLHFLRTHDWKSTLCLDADMIMRQKGTSCNKYATTVTALEPSGTVVICHGRGVHFDVRATNVEASRHFWSLETLILKCLATGGTGTL